MSDVDRLMFFLSKEERYLPEALRDPKHALFEQYLDKLNKSWVLNGPEPSGIENGAGDYFYIWRENGEGRLKMTTYTPTLAGISIHARFSDKVATELAAYLEESGFSDPLIGF